jgi:mono/diheme cytochrome c family protein
MNLASAKVLGVAAFALCLAPTAFAEPDVASGEALYAQKCNMCHASGLANAPLTEALTKLEPQKIVDVLTTPSAMMAGAVAGITDEQKRDIAVYLTKKSLPAKDGLPEVKAN